MAVAVEGIDAYWNFERRLRKAEADDRFLYWVHRRRLRDPARALSRRMPDDTILDDVVIPMQIAPSRNARGRFPGRRVAHRPAALGSRSRSLAGNAERSRENIPDALSLPGWLLPWQKPPLVAVVRAQVSSPAHADLFDHCCRFQRSASLGRFLPIHGRPAAGLLRSGSGRSGFSRASLRHSGRICVFELQCALRLRALRHGQKRP